MSAAIQPITVDHRRGWSLWLWIAIGVALIAVIGFGRSYFFKFLFTSPPLRAIVHLHGLLVTSWLALFVTQTWLISKRQVGWHQRLGVVGVCLAGLVILSGAYLTLAGLQTELNEHRVGRFHFLLGLNAVNLVVFVVLLSAGLLARKNPQYHKRFMTMAAIVLLAPATARIVLLFTHAIVWQYIGFYITVGAPILVDTVMRKRLHPAFGWSALLIVSLWQLTYVAESSSGWVPWVQRVFG